MISHPRSKQQIIDSALVKVIGIGGAGGNLLERIALDGMNEAGLLLLHADARFLASSVVPEKIHLGKSLLKGLGAGGDPELGEKAALEVEDDLRKRVRGQQLVFLCVGLGGGTGSGAAPVAARIAREEGAFVVVFATMPFAFEGKRRCEQADAAARELASLADAFVVFDNNRMGELVLAKQGAYDAFAASDRIVSESIRSIVRMLTRRGLIHLGLDELISALGNGRSHCLFGCGTADGKDRSSAALRQALASPLLDQGAMLKNADTVLVHLIGGQDLTLLEIELLMEGLQKFVSADANLFFGAAVDPEMGSSLTLSIISSAHEGFAKPAARERSSAATVVDSYQPPSPDPVPAPVSESVPVIAPTDTPPSLPVEEDLFVTGSVESAPIAPPDHEGSFNAVAEETLHEPEVVESIKPAVPAKPWKKSTESQTVEQQKIKLTVKASEAQSELSLDSVPRGRFEGENPNVFEGEDLDLPPFLRKKK